MKLRRIAKILGGLVALILTALIAIPFFISAEFLKTQLQEQVKKATGRTLEIKGATSLTLFPNIAIRAEDVTLGNPAGFTTPYLVQLQKLETGAALQPLLAKELRITGVTLVGATMHLEQNAAGAKNWEFPKTASTPSNESKQPDAKKSLNAFAIGDIVIKDSAFSFHKPGAKPLAAKNISLTLSGADGSKALKLAGSMTYQNAPVSLKVTAGKMKALMAGKTSPVALSLTLPTGTVAFDGTASNAQGLALDGALNLDLTDLPALMAWATNKPAASGLPKKMELASKLAFRGMQNIALNDLKLAADALAVDGKLSLNLTGAVPSLRGALHLPLLDTAALPGARPATSATGGGQASAAPQGWSDAPLNLTGLRAVNANLDLAIDALRAGKIEAKNIAARVDLQGGVLKLNLGNASLYGGTAKGTVSANGSGAVAGIGTNLTFSGIQIEPLMVALSGASRLEGRTNLTLNLNGSGTSQRALVGSLAGNGALNVSDGAVKGINIASFLRDAKKGFLLADKKTETTDFTELTASYQIAQGILSNADLSMKSPVLRLAGKGTVNLPARSLNYRLEPTLVGTLKGQGAQDTSRTGITIPLVIAGPWASPSITPDLAGTLEDALKNPEALKQNLKDINGQIKNFNSPKDIGKALLGGITGEPAPVAPAPATPTTAPGAPAPATAPAPAPAAAPTPAPTKEQLIQQGVGQLLKGL